MVRKKREFNIFHGPQKEETKGRNSDTSYLETIGQSKAEERTFSESKKNYIRHTFVIHPQDLRVLQEVVHIVKSTGRYTYTQKEALHDAIVLLRASINKR